MRASGCLILRIFVLQVVEKMKPEEKIVNVPIEVIRYEEREIQVPVRSGIVHEQKL